MKRFRSPTGQAAPVRLAPGLLSCMDWTERANPHARVDRSVRAGNVRGEQAPGRPTSRACCPESSTGRGPAHPPVLRGRGSVPLRLAGSLDLLLTIALQSPVHELSRRPEVACRVERSIYLLLGENLAESGVGQ